MRKKGGVNPRAKMKVDRKREGELTSPALEGGGIPDVMRENDDPSVFSTLRL